MQRKNGEIEIPADYKRGTPGFNQVRRYLVLGVGAAAVLAGCGPSVPRVPLAPSGGQPPADGGVPGGSNYELLPPPEGYGYHPEDAVYLTFQELQEAGSVRPTSKPIIDVQAINASQGTNLQEYVIFTPGAIGGNASEHHMTHLILDPENPRLGGVVVKQIKTKDFIDAPVYANMINDIALRMEGPDTRYVQSIREIPTAGLLEPDQLIRVTTGRSGEPVVMTRVLGVSPETAATRFGIHADEGTFAALAGDISRAYHVIPDEIKFYMLQVRNLHNVRVPPFIGGGVRFFPFDGHLRPVVLRDGMFVLGNKTYPPTDVIGALNAYYLARLEQTNGAPITYRGLKPLEIHPRKILGRMHQLQGTFMAVNAGTILLQILDPIIDAAQLAPEIDHPQAFFKALQVTSQNELDPDGRRQLCERARSAPDAEMVIPATDIPAEGQSPKLFLGEVQLTDGSSTLCNMLRARFTVTNDAFIIRFEPTIAAASALASMNYDGGPTVTADSEDQSFRLPWDSEHSLSVIMADGSCVRINIIPPDPSSGDPAYIHATGFATQCART